MKKSTPKQPTSKKSMRASTTTSRQATRTPATNSTGSKKSPPITPTPRKTVPLTTVIAKTNIGWGNNLYLRGEGNGLSWKKGILMDNTSSEEWVWTTQAAPEGLQFKFLINDNHWATGENITLSPGGTSIATPVFE